MNRGIYLIVFIIVLILISACSTLKEVDHNKFDLKYNETTVIQNTKNTNTNQEVSLKEDVNKTNSVNEHTSDEELNENNNKEYPIDIEFKKEMSNWSGNTSEGVDIVHRYGDKWKVEVEKYYKLLYNELNDDKKKWLISSQKKWEIYSEDNRQLSLQIYEQKYSGGSIIQMLYADTYYNSYRDRAIDLIKKYEELTLDK